MLCRLIFLKKVEVHFENYKLLLENGYGGRIWLFLIYQGINFLRLDPEFSQFGYKLNIYLAGV